VLSFPAVVRRRPRQPASPARTGQKKRPASPGRTGQKKRPASEGGPYKRVLSLTRQAVRLSTGRGRANGVN